MKKTFCAVVAAILLSGTSAFAADVVPPAPAFDWSGPYVGAFGEYGFGASRHFNAAGDTGNFGLSGVLGGLDGGVNIQKGKTVFGVELDGALSGYKGQFPGGPCGVACDTNLNWLSTARARIGIAAGKALFYGTGGLAVGNITADCCGGGTTNSGTSTALGYALGGGIELAVSRKLTARLQYLYVNLGTPNYNSGGTVNVKADTNNLISFGLNYKF